MAIDRKQPNPIKCSDDIATFNKIKQEQRFYQFLIGIDEKVLMTQVMIFDAQVPIRFWPEVAATSAYLLNRLPSQIFNHRTPLQILATQTNIPLVQMLPPRVFGCSMFVHIPKANRTKFDPCPEKCVFVGYATHQKGIDVTT